MGMAGRGKAARNAGSTGRQETIKPFPRIRSTGHDIEGWELNEVQIPGIKIGRYEPFLDSLALLSLYSVITLIAHLLIEKGASRVRSTAWYAKSDPTFSDAIALVRRHLWDHLPFSTSQQETDMMKIPRALFARLMDVMSYAA
jgi:hypothetical protein